MMLLLQLQWRLSSIHEISSKYEPEFNNLFTPCACCHALVVVYLLSCTCSHALVPIQTLTYVIQSHYRAHHTI